ncbi:hypothetical protein TGAM01_v210895 [Trichoderma gamsii]|uniref:Uncharacterized protein n=1 Tax=Trichoderma gamsii TaxID=398673 RepID=A0A2P4Z7I4_9HYPO|nr:hypothetical protein TGAM01_v210895 [Trichoderma gamsii]PON20253.1 hypothetical protein TGAM01_v210895 [Trichoderma gamsii]
MAHLNPVTITTAPSQEPFTLQPLIRQALSTRRCIDIGAGGPRAVHPGLAAPRHVLPSGKERWDAEHDEKEREKEDEKGMVYLIVNELEMVGWNESYMAMWRRHKKAKTLQMLSSQLWSQASDKSQQQPIALPENWHDHQVSLKLTTLRLIPHLPYAQNWSVNVLATVASLSPVEPSHLPPGKQRTARIADPSTAKQVQLTVFLDPEGFAPRVGSAVLLVGVKNHRFDRGSLKKYASDGKRESDRRWWFEDPWHMSWLDVAGIKSWWQGVEEHYRMAG